MASPCAIAPALTATVGAFGVATVMPKVPGVTGELPYAPVIASLKPLSKLSRTWATAIAWAFASDRARLAAATAVRASQSFW